MLSKAKSRPIASGTLEEYLLQRHTKSTTERYLRDIKAYLRAVGEAKAKNATYGDIMDYVEILRKRYPNPDTIKVVIHSIKKYYSWLNHTEHRKTHPCRNLKLREKTNRDVQLQDLFKPEELEILMDRKERYSDLKTKNRVVVSLLIYQALTRNDIVRLTLKDIDLNNGTIYIKADTRTNRRTLKLKPNQILLMHQYIIETRIKLINKSTHQQTDILIRTKTGTPEQGEGIGYLLETARNLFPERKLNAQTIRQSVIANLLKSGHGLRLVQTFAGHKYPSATERYRQTGIEELKAGVQKYHPLK